jgi:hypothetical protein
METLLSPVTPMNLYQTTLHHINPDPVMLYYAGEAFSLNISLQVVKLLKQFNFNFDLVAPFNRCPFIVGG